VTQLASDALPTDTLGQDLGAAHDPTMDPTTAPGAGGVDTQQAADKQTAAINAAMDAARTGGATVTTTTGGMSGGLPDSGTGIGSKIVTAAEKMLGLPYVWGGESASGVDCSGLVALAYKAAGITLPRISFQQANSGTRIDLAHARPGDLIAWDNSPRNPGADHIAIYLGGGKIIEAAAPGTNVRIRTLGAGENYWAVKMGW
jgi:cell wall-associated NlpC family hydrolase